MLKNFVQKLFDTKQIYHENFIFPMPLQPGVRKIVTKIYLVPFIINTFADWKEFVSKFEIPDNHSVGKLISQRKLPRFFGV